MGYLKLYKEREPHKVEIKERGGSLKTFLVPFELTIAELEKVLEIDSQIEDFFEQKVEKDHYDYVRQFWDFAFAQIAILFQHYQPEVTPQYLKENMSEEQALEFLNFFEKYRKFQPSPDGVKKKLNPKTNSSA